MERGLERRADLACSHPAADGHASHRTTERSHTLPTDESWMSLPPQDPLNVKTGDRLAFVLDATSVKQDDCVATRGMFECLSFRPSLAHEGEEVCAIT